MTPSTPETIGKIANLTDFQASGIVIHPNDWMRVELSKDANGQYLVGNIFLRNEIGNLIKAPSIWGLPVAVSKSITEGTALVGGFNIAAQLFRRTGLLIEASNSDGNNFTQNLVTIRAEQRAALAVYAPLAFCKCTGLPNP